MPNYCWNHVTITGNKKQLKKIKKKFDKYEESTYFTSFGDYVLDIGKINDNYDVIKNRYGNSFDTCYIYGTKWWDFEMELEGGCLTISGDSAWSPPVELIEEICKHYKVKAHMEYEECGCDFGGQTIINEQGIERCDDYSYCEWKYIVDPVEFIESDRRYLYEGNIDELDEDIKEGYYDFMSKEHLCELIDIVREDAEKLQETE